MRPTRICVYIRHPRDGKASYFAMIPPQLAYDPLGWALSLASQIRAVFGVPVWIADFSRYAHQDPTPAEQRLNAIAERYDA